MMIKRPLLPVVLLLLFVAACDTSGISSEDLSGEALIPLDVGNEWIWRTTERTTHTGEIRETVRYDTMRVVSEVSLMGESWFRLEDGDAGLLVTNRESGYWQRQSVEGDAGDPLLIYKYPAEIGDTFFRPSFPDSSIIRVESLDTTITVPAGTFQAVHYAQIWDDQPITCDFFVAPGVGLIKKELPWIEVQTGEVVRIDTQELTAFTRG